MFVFEIRVRIVKTLLIAGFLLSTVNAMAEAVPVELLRTEDGWQLLRDGKHREGLPIWARVRWTLESRWLPG